MGGPRWRKVFRDLWTNKTRTILVVLSIAVGVFAVGLIACTQVILLRDMNTSYAATNPAHATLYVEPFAADLIESVRRMPGVADASGHNSVDAQVRVDGDDWSDFVLIVVPDYSDMRINIVKSVSGAWPPRKREILLERTSLDYLGVEEGDTITIESSDGKLHDLVIAGAVHDQSIGHASIDGKGYGYITPDTLELLGEGRQLDELRITVTERPDDKDHIYNVVQDVQSKVEKGGYTVYGSYVPTPGQHWATDIMRPLLLILGILGSFSLLLTGFLVTNTISSLLTQHTRQIGVMKAIGARTSQVMQLYLVTVVAYSLLSLLVAVPLGAVGAWAFVSFSAGMLNFDVVNFELPLPVLALEIVAGLIVPVFAAFWPIMARTRITVREALASTGLDADYTGTQLIDRLLGRIRILTRPQMISLRNLLRRRLRLTLTLVTLTLSGVMVISVFTVRSSLLQTLDTLYQIYQMDISIDLSEYYRITRMKSEALKVPGVVALEGWGTQELRRIRPDKTESNNIRVLAPPTNTQLFRPIILEGRWLNPSDDNAVVITSSLLQEEPDLKVGTDLVLKVNEREMRWKIVGITNVLFAGNQVYVNYPYFAQTIGVFNRSGYALVATEQHDGEFREQVARQLADQFKRSGLRVQSIQTVTEDREEEEERFNILVVFLLMMAALLSMVGGLGLMGTMSISVLERTREIGVMRAIGASSWAILRIVLFEGLLIGLLSWALATLLALPLSKLLSDAVGVAFLRLPLDFSFSIGGALLWLVVVSVLSVAASFLPARKAARVTVRDALAYE